MGQTTGAISFKAAKVEYYATGATTWTDISGTFNKVTQSGHTRSTGKAFTADGDTAIITRGKLEPVELDVTCVYSEIANETFKAIHDLHVTAGGTDIFVRLTPKGTATGDQRFTCTVGTITSCGIPVGEVGKADPVLFSFKVEAAAITQATAA
jgi:hypothetical protein